MNLYFYEFDKREGKIREYIVEAKETKKMYKSKKPFPNGYLQISKEDLNKVESYYFSANWYVADQPAEKDAVDAFIMYHEEEKAKLMRKIEEEEKVIDKIRNAKIVKVIEENRC